MLPRRVFLQSSGLALVSFGALPRLLLRAAQAADGVPRRRTLVVIFQRGACDGLNTVAPWGERAYYDARRTIAVPAPRGSSRKTALDLDGFFGLHPALEPLLPLWREGSLAAVHAVGSPDATRSHFDAQDFMESGTPGRKATEDGWMNRHLQATPDPGATPLRAVSLTPVLPRSLQGRGPAVAMASLRGFGLGPLTGEAVARGFEGMYGAAVEDALRSTGREAFEAMGALRSAEPSRRAPEAGARYPRGPLGESLRQIAQLLKADLGVELAFTEIGGWDHHAAEGGVTGQLASRLRELAAALFAFHRDLGPRMADVVLVTLTEFGRTVRENGNRGTDHGHGSVSLVMGGAVQGGKVHGRWPGLAPSALFEGRDLAVTTDFRDLLAELLARHLGARDLGPVFPGHAVAGSRFPGVLRT
ncbi:MAG: hypothetical protein A2V74_10280 [Acidobacteria bacterium RBG_16_70_10]|nr:MAG: hypothetical protein A2V74_10280 [Acidobacteria bacterium RBG_16_70_10]